MMFYWRLGSIPELSDLPAASRRARWRQALAQTRPRDSAAAAALTAAAVFVVVYVATVVIWPRQAGLGFLVTVLVSAAATVLIQRWRRQPAARAWLREHPEHD